MCLIPGDWALIFSAIGTLALASVTFWAVRKGREDKIISSKINKYNKVYNWLKRASLNVVVIRRSDSGQWVSTYMYDIRLLIAESDSIIVLLENLKRDDLKADFININNNLKKIDPILSPMVWMTGGLEKVKKFTDLKLEESIEGLMKNILDTVESLTD